MHLELVAISRGAVYNHKAAGHVADEVWVSFNEIVRPKEHGPYEHYNVLYITWEDGIAYRQESGMFSRKHGKVWSWKRLS